MTTYHFTPEVAEKLKIYVYRLIDPRTGETFYVGKGQGDRVFAHSCAELKADDDIEESKIQRIRDIRQSGFEVAHVIHRHGMDDATALEVEAAVIDAYPGLTNIANGSGSDEFGVMHGDEINRRYSATPANLEHLKAVLINVNRSAAEGDLYESTRYCWRMSLANAEQAELVMATIQGVIAGVFIPEKWLRATAENFAGREPDPNRIGFEGSEAPREIREKYVGYRVPDSYRKKGAANPIRYTWN